MSQEALILDASDAGRPLAVLGTQVTVLAAKEATGSYEITMQEGPEGTGPPPHEHPWDEAFFVLEGELEFSVGDAHHRGGPGTFVHVPAGTVHGFRYGPGGGRILEVTSPGGQAVKLFGEIDAEVAPGPPDIPQLVAILERNGASVRPPE